jgi:hypothetical protein
MKKQALSCGIALSAFLLTCHPATAAPVTVPNFSFESPDAPDGTSTETFTDWTVTIFRAGDAFVFDPAGSPPANGDGAQYADLVTQGISGPSTFVTLVSAASLLTIEANTTYTLTIAVAQPSPAEHQNSTYSLFAGSTSAASAFTNNAPATFTDFSTSFTTAPSGDPLVGQPLTVELRLSGSSGSGFSFGTLFDNVRVDATAAPEPSALLMGCTGLVALGMRRSRRPLVSRSDAMEV